MGVGKVKKEVWKDIDGFEGNYSVSNWGRVRSYDRIVTHRCKYGNYDRLYRGKVLKKAIESHGYETISLCLNGKRITGSVHRLVATAFLDNPENKNEVNHINGVKTDNRVENLEWTTRKENNDHAIENGLIKVRGSSNNNAKLTKKEVSTIVEKLTCGVSVACLSKEFGVKKPAIWKIQHGYTWSHVTGIQKH